MDVNTTVILGAIVVLGLAILFGTTIMQAATVQVPIPDSTVKNITLTDKYPAAETFSNSEPTIVDQDGVTYNVRDTNIWQQMVVGDTYQIGWTGSNPKEVWGVSKIDS